MLVDLHVHSALSACAENSLAPGRIVGQAVRRGLDLIAITDHNASAHAALAVELGRRVGLNVVPGMEVTTREDVHVLALFDSLDALLALQACIDAALPEQENNTDFFGMQLLYDSSDEIIDTDDRLRQIGVDIGLVAVTALIHGLGGYAVPAHVFRHRNSLGSQLGFIPEGAGFDAVEVGAREWMRRQCAAGSRVAGYPVLTSSDAHFLEDIGRNPLAVPRRCAGVGEILSLLGDLRA